MCKEDISMKFNLSEKLICFIFFIFLSAAVFSEDTTEGFSEAGSKYYRNRTLGFIAFNEGRYGDAARFFSRYLKNAEAGEDNNSTADALLALCSAYIHGDKADKAIDALNLLKEKFPDYNPSLIELKRADILTSQGELDAAAELYKSIISKLSSGAIPNNRIYLFSLLSYASTLAKLNEWKKAARVYSFILSLGDKKSEKFFIAGENYVLSLIYSQQFKKAASELKKLREKFSEKESLDLDKIALYLLIRQEKLNEALQNYDLLRADMNEGADKLFYSIDMKLAELLIKKERNADVYLKDALTFAPDDKAWRKAAYKIVDTYIKGEKFDQAEKELIKITELYNGTESGFLAEYNLADLYHQTEKFNKAEKIYSRLIENLKCPLKIRIDSAFESYKIYLSDKSYAKAEKTADFIFKNAEKVDVKGQGLFKKAELDFLQGNYVKACEEYLRVSADFNVNRYKAIFKALISYEKTKQYDNAIQLARKILDETLPDDPANIKTQFYYAYLLYIQGKTQKALAKFADFIKKNPKSEFISRALFLAGKCKFRASEISDAKEYFIKAAEKSDKDSLAPKAYYASILCSVALADNAETEKLVKNLFKNFPESEYSKAAMFKLVDIHIENDKFATAEKVLNLMRNEYLRETETDAEILYKRALKYLAMDSSAENNKNKYLLEAKKILENIAENYSRTLIYSDSQYLLGDVYSNLGKYDEALSSYRRVLNSTKTRS